MDAPTEDEVLSYFDRLSNWGRFGDDDELGTLNFVTAETRVEAARLVVDGQPVSCSRPISVRLSRENPEPLLHFMIESGDGAPEHGQGAAADFIGLRFHGRAITHIDSLCHFFWNRQTYNGRPADVVRTVTGVGFGSIENARHGIFSRGVLLDVPRAEGVEHLEPGDEISPERLERCAEQTGVRPGRGDVLIVRTGRDAIDEPDGRRAGLRADCLPWLHAREIAVLVGDQAHDVRPPRYPAIRNPIHAVGIVALGLWLLDNAYLEDLAKECAARGRWEFLFTTAPLVLQRTTGSPINPVAIF